MLSGSGRAGAVRRPFRAVDLSGLAQDAGAHFPAASWADRIGRRAAAAPGA